jgi:dUTP pyrophosphatase
MTNNNDFEYKSIDIGYGFVETVRIPVVQFIKEHPDAVLPSYANDGDSGLDLSICERVEIGPGERKLVTTGLKVRIPYGYEGQVRPRSGNANKLGITVLNTPGTIDSTYRGTLKVILYNTSKETITFMCPDKIAQLVICPVSYAKVKFVDSFDETARNEGGFGSTGL